MHEETKNGFKLSVVHDDFNTHNPIEEECGALGTYACLHKRYKLGNTEEFKTPEQLDDFLEQAQVFSWPLYMMDHSGLTIALGADKFRACDPCGWDWGKLGHVFVTHEKAREFFPSTPQEGMEEKVYISLKAELEEYNKFLQGDCYGFVIIDTRNDDIKVDSCWGFLGFENCLEEARHALDHCQRKQLELPRIII